MKNAQIDVNLQHVSKYTAKPLKTISMLLYIIITDEFLVCLDGNEINGGDQNRGMSNYNN